MQCASGADVQHYVPARPEASNWLFEACVLGCHIVLLSILAIRSTPNVDELAHLPCGVIHWRYGRFDFYRVNPPLIRMIAALPALVLRPSLDFAIPTGGPYSRPEFVLGGRFMQANGRSTRWHIAAARLALLPVSLLGALTCYWWARDLFGLGPGRVALLIWAFSPDVLAWGGTILPDIGAAAFASCAGYHFYKWSRMGGFRETLSSGLFLGCALLSKSTLIILVPLWITIAVLGAVKGQGRSSRIKHVFEVSLICTIGILIVNMGYAFYGTLKPLGAFQFTSALLGGPEAHESPGNRFRGSWVGKIPVGVPEDYVLGVDVQRRDFEVGKWSFLRGEMRFGGWYHYYIYALSVKTPIGTLVVAALGAWLAVFTKAGRARWEAELIIWGAVLAILLVVSSQTGFNRYLRYLLPAYPFGIVAISRAGLLLDLQRSVWATAIVYGAMIGTIVASLSVYPFSMSYFNCLVGGPRGGHRHLLDANIDWGQDLFYLKEYLDAHPEIDDLGVSYFGAYDVGLAGISSNRIIAHEEHSRNALNGPRPGWYAVSVNHVYGYRQIQHARPKHSYFAQFKPVHVIGYSIYLYHLTEDDIGKLRLSRSTKIIAN
jgi:hypothetical protein